MLRTLCFCSLCWLLCATAQAQTPDCTPKDYERLMAEAKRLAKIGEYDKAINKLQSAKTCQPQREAEVNREVLRVFEQVNGERKRAEEQTKKAEAEARRIYANDIAFKSQVALRDGDRTTAFRLAEMAYRYVDDDNDNVTRAFVAALYYNDHADTTHQLPWVTDFLGHTGYIYSVAFSPDGNLLYSRSGDYTAKIWDMETGKTIRTFAGHDRGSIVFSPDGKHLATAPNDAAATIWDMERGEEIATLNGSYSAYSYSLVFSPSGKLLATNSEKNIAIVWDWVNNKEMLVIPGRPAIFKGAAFSPDEQFFAITSYNNDVQIWDLKTGKEPRLLVGHTDDILSVAFSPDGKILATASKDNTIKLWDLMSGLVINTLIGHSAAVNSISISSDGRYIASGSDDNVVKIWDLKSGKEVVNLVGHTASVKSVTFSPNGKYLATASEDKTIKIWDLKSSGEAQILEHGGLLPDSRSFFSPDGKHLAVTSYDHAPTIWDLKSGVQTIKLPGTKPSYTGAFSPNGKRLAAIYGNAQESSVTIWDLEGKKEVLTIDNQGSVVANLAFSPDGKSLATTSYSNNNIKVWNAESGKETATLFGFYKSVDTVINTGSNAWSVKKNRGNSCVVYSPNGKLLATAALDTTARIWDLETKRPVFSLKGDMSRINSVAFSPDGKFLATESSIGNRIRAAKIWNLDTRKVIMTLKGHADPIKSLHFSPNGKMLVTASDDRTAKIWNVVTGKEIVTLSLHEWQVGSATFSPDGKRLATTSGITKIWDLSPDGWRSTPKGHGRRFASLTVDQLTAFGLEKLLDQDPGNEQRLLATHETYQIAAFADLYAQKISETGFPQKTDYERATRLYQACLDSGVDNAYFQIKMADLKRIWQEKNY
jgi:WD40 repeat protein